MRPSFLPPRVNPDIERAKKRDRAQGLDYTGGGGGGRRRNTLCNSQGC